VLLAAPTVAEAKAGCELIEVMLAKGDARLKGVGADNDVSLDVDLG
jgi:hypothetical protein